MRNILFCGNSKVFGGFLSAMLSILMRTETKEPFQFFILTMDLSHLNPDYKPHARTRRATARRTR